MSGLEAAALRARVGILHHATQCESALRLAAFADSEPMLGDRLSRGLRRLAEASSEHAFRWGTALQRAQAGVA